MDRTRKALEGIVNYEAMAGIRPLAILAVEKEEVPQYIACPGYERVRKASERRMEQYDRKVAGLADRLQDSLTSIGSLRQQLGEYEKRADRHVDRDNAQSVARHNDAVDMVRRTSERVSEAIDKHNDLVGLHKDALEEQREEQERLHEESLAQIDADIVSCLDRCLVAANRLSDGLESDDDLLAALEICFLAFKINRAFEVHVGDAGARQEGRKRVGEGASRFTQLCEKSELRNSLNDLFSRNAHLLEENTLCYPQIQNIIGAVDQQELNSRSQSFDAVFAHPLTTDFQYEGIIDPTELERVVQGIEKAIGTVEANVVKAQELFAASRGAAEGAADAHRRAEAILATMRGNAENLGEAIFSLGHFACDVINETVIEQFFDRPLREPALALRQHVVGQLAGGERTFNDLTREEQDRFLIGKAEALIQDAGLLRLAGQRDRVDGHLKGCSDAQRALRGHLDAAKEVPRKNASAFRSSVSQAYVLSYIPLFGFIFGLQVLGKVKKFELAFRSTNTVYRELGAETLAKNRTAQKVNTFMLINLPGAAVLAQAGKRLESYLGTAASGQ